MSYRREIISAPFVKVVEETEFLSRGNESARRDCASASRDLWKISFFLSVYLFLLLLLSFLSHPSTEEADRVESSSSSSSTSSYVQRTLPKLRNWWKNKGKEKKKWGKRCWFFFLTYISLCRSIDNSMKGTMLNWINKKCKVGLVCKSPVI